MPEALMTKRNHIPDRESCPFLPPAEKVLGPSDSKALRGQEGYYLITLTCAQSLWLQGKPAQALLQLNHALSISADAPEVWPLPYQAKVWIFTRRHEPGFMGNPVRHYQHLASRMSGPNSHLRSWRAWACFHLAECVLPVNDYPRDAKQIKNEQLHIPSYSEVLENINLLGWAGEANTVNELLNNGSYQKASGP